ncbi:MAG: M28 family peptidase [Phycisphaerae bacterium]|nr:M28 family peptidase [Phycisphaerae bacterium]
MRTPPTAPRSLADLETSVRAHVDMLAGLIGPRHLGRPSSFDATLAYLRKCLGRHGETLRDETYDVDGHVVRNLILERLGTRHPDRIVVLGAHYDTVPTTPGADDNASAVAALLESASLLFGVELPYTVRFVAFANEEPPYFYSELMGSQVHARRARQRGDDIRAMVCLEMLGYFRDEVGSQGIPSGIPRFLRRLFPSRGDFLASVGNLRSVRNVWQFDRGFRAASRLPLFSIALPERVREIRLSDNSSFWDQGYPAIMLTDTSFFRNPHYHLRSDTADTLDYPRLALGALGVAGGVARLAGCRSRRVLQGLAAAP